MYLACCLEGLEDIAAKELKGKKILPGRVSCTSHPKDPRSITLFYKLQWEGTAATLEDLKKSAAHIPEIKGTIALEVLRRGSQPFNSMEIKTAMVPALVERGMQIDWKKPETTVVVDLYEANVKIGILVQGNLQHRSWYVRRDNQSMDPTIAFATLQLANLKKTDTLIDPWCRDGVIAIEAATSHQLKKIAGCDSNKFSLAHAQINSKLAHTAIEWLPHPLDWLDTAYKKGEFSWVISFPPLPSKRNAKAATLLREFFHQAAYLAKKGIILISPRKDLLSFGENLVCKEQKEIKKGKSNVYLFVLSTSQR